MEKLKRKYLTIDEMTGVFAISLVEEAAVEKEFQAFNRVELKENFKAINEEKRIAVGVIMRPEFWMLRKNETTGEYYEAAFSEETIRQIAFQYMQEENQKNVTIQHEYSVKDVCLVESWIVENPQIDKAAALGFEVEQGTWMGTFKVLNDKVWSQIKDKSVKGFSVEGWFLSEFNKEIPVDEDEILLEEVKKLLEKLDENQ